jgi:hypothetical protein
LAVGGDGGVIQGDGWVGCRRILRGLGRGVSLRDSPVITVQPRSTGPPGLPVRAFGGRERPPALSHACRRG